MNTEGQHKGDCLWPMAPYQGVAPLEYYLPEIATMPEWHMYNAFRRVCSNCMRILLNHGVNINARSRNGWPIIRYSWSGASIHPDDSVYLERCKTYIDWGARVEGFKDDQPPQTLVEYAAISAARRRAAQDAALAMMVAVRPLCGRWVASMIGRAVWVTRRSEGWAKG
jgi:hypothetical protein